MILTDRAALIRHRERGRSLPGHAEALFLHHLALSDLQERLSEVNRRFTTPAVVTGFPEIFGVLSPTKVVSDDDLIALEPSAHDLVVHGMSLH